MTASSVTPLRSSTGSDASKAGFSESEWAARVDLAAAYRLCALYGWDDLLGTHLSTRVPGTEDQFLINPYGLLFEEITASCLVKIDINGNKLSESPYKVNEAGFVIHSAVHMGRHDAECIIHLHTREGVGVSMQKHGLLPASQRALTAWNLIRYHDYEGVAFDLAERDSLLRDLNDGAMLILRNHGTLTVGSTVAEAFNRMYRLQRACEFQIAALSGGSEISEVPAAVIQKTTEQGKYTYGKGQTAGGALAWRALIRKLDRIDPSYAT
jgi:ribulose-5-phosphate 4-epimerase/fuculose-1-phosphate aldolase